MAKVRVMYWKEIPVQIKAEDEWENVSIMLDGRFQQGVDAVSMLDDSSSSEDYMMGWQWGPVTDVFGDAREVAQEMAERFNEGFPRDLVARIRDLHHSGDRDSRPGAIDHWIEDGPDNGGSRNTS